MASKNDLKYILSLNNDDFNNKLKESGVDTKKLDKSLDKIEQTSKKTFSSAVQGVANLSLAFMGVSRVIEGVINASEKYTSTFATQERAEQRVKSVLGENIKQYTDYASSIQSVTTTGDEQILGLQALAGSFGVLPEKINETVKEAVGLSKAFESAGLSQELALKGLSGNITVLTRYIPALKDANTETEKQAILQEAAAKGFKIATEEAKTQAGQLQQLENISGDLDEEIGRQLIPLVIELKKGLNGLFSEILDNDEKIEAVIDGLINGIKFVGENITTLATVAISTVLVPAVISLVGWISTLGTELTLASGGLNILIGAVVGLVASGVISAMSKEFGDINDELEKFSESSATYIKDLEKLSDEELAYYAKTAKAKEKAYSQYGKNMTGLYDKYKKYILLSETLDGEVNNRREKALKEFWGKVESIAEEAKEIVLDAYEKASAAIRKANEGITQEELEELKNRTTNKKREIEALAEFEIGQKIDVNKTLKEYDQERAIDISENLNQQVEAFRENNQVTVGLIENSVSQTAGLFQNLFDSVIDGGQGGMAILEEFGKSFLKSTVGVMVQIGAQTLANSIISNLALSSTVVAQTAGAAAVAAAWLPAAAFAAIGSFGGAGAAGSASILSTFAVAKGASLASNFLEKGGEVITSGNSAMVGGNRHSNGGTKFVGSDGTTAELENGERLFVLNRGATEEFNNLTALNNRFIGSYANGGSITPSVTNITNNTTPTGSQVVQLVVDSNVLAEIVNNSNNNSLSSGAIITESS